MNLFLGLVGVVYEFFMRTFLRKQTYFGKISSMN